MAESWRDWEEDKWRGYFLFSFFIILLCGLLWLIGTWLGWRSFEKIATFFSLIFIPLIVLSFFSFGFGKKLFLFIFYSLAGAFLPFAWLHYRILRSISKFTPEPWYLVELFGKNTQEQTQVLYKRPWSLSDFYLALKRMLAQEWRPKK